MKKEIRDGKVGVLYTPHYGSGWSTWTYEQNEDMIFDPTIIKYVEALNNGYVEGLYDELEKYCAETYPQAYESCIPNLAVEWIPVGTKFRITEYDGLEEIEVMEDVQWLEA